MARDLFQEAGIAPAGTSGEGRDLFAEAGIAPPGQNPKTTDAAGRSMGERAADLAKGFGGAAISAIGAIPTAVGRAVQEGGETLLGMGMDEARRLAEAEGTPEKALDWYEKSNRFNPISVVGRGLQGVGSWVAGQGDALRDARSPTAKALAQDATPTGDITQPSTWSMGANPTLEGVAHVLSDVAGSVAPQVATAVATRGKSAATQMQVGGAVTAGQIGGSAMQEASEYLGGFSDQQLREASPVFRDLEARGYSAADARTLLERDAQNRAASYAAPVGFVGGQATGALLGRAGDRIAAGAKGIGAKAAVLGALGASEEGLQEVAEGVATRAGINDAAGTSRSLTEGTFTEAVLGAKAGAGMGAGKAVVQGIGQRLEDRRNGQDTTQAGDPGQGAQAAPADAAPAVAGAAGRAAAAGGAGTRAASAGVEAVGVGDTAEAERALRAPVQLTALDRVNEIDAEIAGIAERAQALTAENGYGPAFDQERADLDARAQALAAERAGIAKTWPQALPGAPASFSTEAGVRLEGQYALMDAADLVTSHDEGLRANPLYPQELQPRDRSRSASELQVSGIVQKLDPARLGLSADAATGAPIVGADGLVESGNARTIALKRVYQANGQKADDYKAWLRENAGQFGLAPESVDALQKPVLVRVRQTPVNRAEFARQANASTVQRMSASEQAVSDAKRLASLEGLKPDENGDFKSSYDFIRQFMAMLPVTEQSDMLETDGQLSTMGYRRIQNAVLAKAYGDSPTLRRMTESMDDNLRNVTKALTRVAPTIAEARDRMQAGTLHSADIAPDLISAVEGLSAIKDKGWSVADELGQGDLTGAKYSPEAAQLLTLLSENIRSPRRIADFLQRYYEALEAAGDPSQASMFGDDGPAPAPADLLKAARGNDDGNTAQNAQRRDDREGAQPDAQGGRQPEDAPGDRGGDQGDGAAGAAAGESRLSRGQGQTGQSEWVMFPAETGTIGIPRAQMPQVKGEHRGALIQFLQGKGIHHETVERKATELKPTQAEFSTQKAGRWKEVREGVDRSVLASSDGYVLDGHHQWVAALALGEPVKVIEFDAPIRQLLAATFEFPSVQQGDGAAMDTGRVQARQDFKDAMADLAMIATRHTRLMMVPEKTPDLMPTLVRLMEAGIREVGYSLKDLVAYVKQALKNDPKLKTFWNKVSTETYRKAAEQAVARASAQRVDDLFAAADASTGQQDLFGFALAEVAGQPKVAMIDGRPYDMRRDNYKAPPASSVVGAELLSKATQLIDAYFKGDIKPKAQIDRAAQSKAEADLRPLLKRAEDAKVAFDQAIINAASAHGTGQLIAPLKSIERAAEKVVNDYQGDAGQIADLLRATVIVERYGDAVKVIGALANDLEIVKIKNKAGADLSGIGADLQAKVKNQDRGVFGGYADVSLVVRTSNGVLAEVQINVPAMMAVKDAQGHKLYEAARVQADGSDVKRELNAVMERVYDEAFAFDPAARRASVTQPRKAASELRWQRETGSPGSLTSSTASSSNRNQPASGIRTNSSPPKDETNSQPGGNLSGTLISTPLDANVSQISVNGYTGSQTGENNSNNPSGQKGDQGWSKGDAKGENTEQPQEAAAPRTFSARELSTFWNFSRALGHAPGEVKVGTPLHAQIKAQYEAAKAEKAADNQRPAAEKPSPADEFVSAPGGGIDYGEITPEMGKVIRRQAGKIRLTNGVQNSDGTGYGLAHIEANHGEQIRKAGFDSVQAFVGHVASRFNEILQAAKGRQLLVAVTDGRRDVMFVQLDAAVDGDFYRVNTAFPASRDYLEKQEAKGSKVLWGGSEPRPAAAGQQPLYAGSPERSTGQGAPIAQGQSESSVTPEPETDKPASRAVQRAAEPAMEQTQTPAFKLPPTIEVGGKQRPTTNSNGKPIHPTEEGVRNFYRWFGDSKAVDAEGKPLVVYHGTSGERTVFEPYWKQLERDATPQELTGSGSIAQIYRTAKAEPEMHFFAEDRGHAETYGEDVVDAYLKIESMAGGPEASREEAIREMLDTNADGAQFYDTDANGGYGGVAYVVRNPTQIKSATGNIGAFDPENPDIRLSRAASAPVGSVDVAALDAMVKGVRATMPNMPKVTVLADPGKAPKGLREYIIRQDAWYDVEGAMHEGQLYLFASGLSDMARAEHVLLEHEAAHYGLRAVLGGSLRTAMNLVYAQNAAVRKAATELQKRGKLSNAEAVEEVIVDMPSAELARLKGWRKVVMLVRDWLHAHGFVRTAAKLGQWLDGSLSQQQRADLFVADLVRSAREYVAGKSPARRTGYMGDTRLSTTLKEDIERQERWLHAEAQARGFKDIEDLLARDYPLFEKLAELWRKKNPAETLLSRSTSTQAAYEQRIDALFAGSKANLKGVRVLDRTEVLGMLGHADKPVELAEGKVIAGQTNHPRMTADVWKKIPTWLDAPAAVFESDTEPGRLVFIAPELVNGAMALVIVDPKQGALDAHLLLNAYDKDNGTPPIGSWARKGLTRYVDQKKFPAILNASGLQLPGTAFQNRPGTRKILTQKDLAGYIKANPTTALSRADDKKTATEAVDLMRASPQELEARRLAAKGGSVVARARAALADPARKTEILHEVIYRMQDRLIDLKWLQGKIAESGGTVSELNDAYRGEELYHRRAAAAQDEFLADELRPLLARMGRAGIAMEQFEAYLHARHAPEANRVLAARNLDEAELTAKREDMDARVAELELAAQRARSNDFYASTIDEQLSEARAERDMWRRAQPFKGTSEERAMLSGMSDAQAAAIMEAVPEDKRATYAAMATQIDAINTKTREMLVGYGLVSRAEADGWASLYQHYVPLHRDEEHPNTRTSMGQGFSVKGKESKVRTGSTAAVTNILAHIATQREAAIARGEKNFVAKKVWLLAAQNTMPGFWSLDVPKSAHVDNATGQVMRGPDPTYLNRPNVLAVKIGGKTHAVVFDERNERAMRLAAELKNLDVQELDWVTQQAGKITRWLSAVNTQYNPVFGVVNFMRDVQAAALQLSTTPLKGREREVLRGARGALRTIWAAEREATRAKREGRAPKAPTDQMGKLWKEMNEAGGMTGYRDAFANIEERGRALEDMIAEGERTGVKRGFFEMVDLLSDYNTAMEGAIRLSVYRVARDRGMSFAKSASLAKNITVNFNRKGAWARRVGPWYAFFNAAVQGTARMVETLGGPSGRKIILGGMGLGFVMAVVASAMLGGDGDDEDAVTPYQKIPDFVKERALIVPLGGEDYLAIPMPLGYNMMTNAGRLVAEQMMGSGKPGRSAAETALDGLTMSLSAFNPLGGADAVQMVTPTPVDWAVDLMRNKDWTGRDIAMTDRSNLDPTPGHTRAKDSATPWAKALSRGVNWMTGGTEFQPGAWSPTPDQIDYVIGQITGGVGREAGKLASTLAAPFTGEDLPANKIPLVGRLYGNTRSPAGGSQLFYENVRKANMLESEISGRVEIGKSLDDIEPYAFDLVGEAAAADSHVRSLRRLKRFVTEQAEPGHQDEVKRINEEIGLVMDDFNREVNRLRRLDE